jgi:hypothetical protein
VLHRTTPKRISTCTSSLPFGTHLHTVMKDIDTGKERLAALDAIYKTVRRQLEIVDGRAYDVQCLFDNMLSTSESLTSIGRQRRVRTLLQRQKPRAAPARAAANAPRLPAFPAAKKRGRPRRQDVERVPVLQIARELEDWEEARMDV